jgi:hypothetical protein
MHRPPDLPIPWFDFSPLVSYAEFSGKSSRIALAMQAAGILKGT